MIKSMVTVLLLVASPAYAADLLCEAKARVDEARIDVAGEPSKLAKTTLYRLSMSVVLEPEHKINASLTKQVIEKDADSNENTIYNKHEPLVSYGPKDLKVHQSEVNGAPRTTLLDNSGAYVFGYDPSVVSAIAKQPLSERPTYALWIQASAIHKLLPEAAQGLINEIYCSVF